MSWLVIVGVASVLLICGVLLYRRGVFSSFTRTSALEVACSQPSIPVVKVDCRLCGAKILPATAERNDGLCAPCSRDAEYEKKRVDDEKALEDAGRQIAEREFHDVNEPRVPEDFERLRELMALDDEDRGRCLDLCLEQVEETPDFDLPIIWASNFQVTEVSFAASVATLVQGLHECRRVSWILNKLGERALDRNEPVVATVALAKSILAQEPPRSSHDSYLNFAYVCRYSDFEDASENAYAIARGIWGGPIDLTDYEKSRIQNVVTAEMEKLQPLVRSCIFEMMKEGRMD